MDETKYARTHLYKHIKVRAIGLLPGKKAREKNTLYMQDGCARLEERAAGYCFEYKAESPWRPEGSGCKIKIQPL